MSGTTPLKAKVLPSRRAAQQANSSFAAQLETLPLREYSPVRGSTTGKKRGRQVEDSDDYEWADRGKKMKTQHYDSDRSSPLSPLTSPVRQLSASSRPDGSGPSKTEQMSSAPPLVTLYPGEKWRVEEGECIFILLDVSDGSCSRKDESDDSRMRIWWPAKVSIRVKNTYTVSLFRKAPEWEKDTIIVTDPSASNLLKFITPSGVPRFITPAFMTSSSRPHPSPRKKRKSDQQATQKQWNRAYQACLRDIWDDVPDISLVKTLPQPEPETRTSSPTPFLQRTPEVDTRDIFTSSLPNSNLYFDCIDINLTVPGEVVFARFYESPKSEYWPAQILDFIPPKGKIGKKLPKGQSGKYLVEFFDKKKKTVARNWFFMVTENWPPNCKFGEVESTVKDDCEASDEVEEEEVDEALDQGACFPSPDLFTQPPPTTKAFLALSLRQQFSYTKPVLTALLNDKYLPAKDRHDVFMAGGAARRGLRESASQNGELSPREVSDLGELVTQWAGTQRTQTRIIDEDGMTASSGDDTLVHLTDGMGKSEVFPLSQSPAATVVESPSSPGPNPPASSFVSEAESDDAFGVEFEEEIPTSNVRGAHEPSSDPFEPEVELEPQRRPIPLQHENSGKRSRQTGCNAFEALNEEERLTYCLDILLLEAKIQILLWRNGDRRSAELLSTMEEQELRSKGLKLLEKRDWVLDCIRARDQKLKQMEDAAGLLSSRGHGKTSRARRG